MSESIPLIADVVANRSAQFEHLRANREWLEEQADIMNGYGNGSLASDIRINLIRPDHNIDDYVYEFEADVPSPHAAILTGAWFDLTKMSTNKKSYKKEIAAAERVVNFVTSSTNLKDSHTNEQDIIKAKIFNPVDVFACADAELYFADTYKQLKSGATSANYQEEVVCYHDNDLKPIALQKSQEFPSAITLAPISLGEYCVPTGSIVYLENNQSIQFKSSTDEKRRLGATLVSKYFKVRPVRTSPWSYEDPIDQAMFGLGSDHRYDKGDAFYHRKKVKTILGISISDMRKVSEDAIKTVYEESALVAI